MAKNAPSPEKANILVDSGAPLYFSVASLWQMTIKKGTGRSDIAVDSEIIKYGDPVIDIRQDGRWRK